MAFINISNHPSDKWSKEQREAALALTKDNLIIDIQFPNVPADMGEEHLHWLAIDISDKIEKMLPMIDHLLDAFMVQGEMTLTYQLIRMLNSHFPGVPCVAACSERNTEETVNREGDVVKVSIFKFIQFRRYS